MLSISIVNAETCPRYLDTVHSLSRSASFHATSLFPFADFFHYSSMNMSAECHSDWLLHLFSEPGPQRHGSQSGQKNSCYLVHVLYMSTLKLCASCADFRN